MTDLSALSAEHLRFIAHERAGEVIKLRAALERVQRDFKLEYGEGCCPDYITEALAPSSLNERSEESPE